MFMIDSGQCLGDDLQDLVQAGGQLLVLAHQLGDLLEVSVLTDVLGDRAACAAGTTRACKKNISEK